MSLVVLYSYCNFLGRAPALNSAGALFRGTNVMPQQFFLILGFMFIYFFVFGSFIALKLSFGSWRKLHTESLIMD